MYLTEALQFMATVTLRPLRLRNEEGARDPDEEEGGCTHTTSKVGNKGYYTEAIGANRLHNLLSCRHKADGKGVHVPAAQFFRKRREAPIFHTL